MRIYALISQKGGAGKSTLATHLATLAAEGGAPSFLIDRDPQATSAKWWERRREIEPAPEWPHLIDLDGRSIEAVAPELRQGEGRLFIDTRPAVQEPEAQAARVADLVIVPVRPTMNDLEAIGDTLDMVRRIGTPAVVVVNSARNAGRAKDARSALSEFGIPVCPHHLTDRTAYHDAAVRGSTVMELGGAAAEAAAAEMRKAWEWIRGVEK